jgi:hypothetical protein
MEQVRFPTCYWMTEGKSLMGQKHNLCFNFTPKYLTFFCPIVFSEVCLFQTNATCNRELPSLPFGQLLGDKMAVQWAFKGVSLGSF